MNLVKELGEIAIGTRLRLLTDRFLQDGAEIYKSQNIDFEPRWFTMFYLLSKNSPLSISEITNELGFTQPAVTQIANVLIKKGLVKTVKHKEDSRKKMLALSANGLQMLPALEPVWKGFEEAVKDLFKETGFDILSVIRKIESSLNEKDMFRRVTEKIESLKQFNPVN